jgi:hypothetical protein
VPFDERKLELLEEKGQLGVTPDQRRLPVPQHPFPVARDR